MTDCLGEPSGSVRALTSGVTAARSQSASVLGRPRHGRRSEPLTRHRPGGQTKSDVF